MRSDLEQLLRDTKLTMVALAIALGWSLFQVGQGVENLVIGAIHRTENSPGGLSFGIARHYFYFDPLLIDLIVFALILAVALFVQRRFRSS
jgi:hypothetical protein